MSAKKDPKQKSIPRTISLPRWMWEDIDEIAEPDKRSEWIRKWIEFGINDTNEVKNGEG